jgi:hypothetical protein
VSIYEPENVGSGRVMDRLGFDSGEDTRHPTLDVPLRVRTLTADTWRIRNIR